MAMSDDEYFRSQSDYEAIKPYLDQVEQEEEEVTYPEFMPDFSAAIIVDGIPLVGEERLAKLESMLIKVYSQICKEISKSDIYIAFDETETQKSLGFAFIKFPTKELAEKAMEVTQGFAIDKKHSFKVTLYSDLDKYGNLTEEYQDEEMPPFKPRPDPTNWLTDPQCRDQFVLRYQKETSVWWANMQGEEPTVVYDGSREKEGGRVWCDSYVQWSPQGTYLATFHKPGVKLWGSSEFEAYGRFIHQNVSLLDFSPCENYLVTYVYADEYTDGPNPEAIIVWDIRSGSKIRTFELKHPLDPKFQVEFKVYQYTEKMKAEGKEPVLLTLRGRIDSYDVETGTFKVMEGSKEHVDVEGGHVQPLQEPNRLKWSPDGQYVARLGCDIISIYSLPSMQLMDKKSIPALNSLDFVWCPSASPDGKQMISYWAPAAGNQPASINIISIPDRENVSTRRLFDVHDGRMVWQNEGTYLCVYMVKVQNRKRTNVLMFFRVKEPEVPVEQLELKEDIISVSWEPSGDRLSIVYGEPRQPTIAFYSMVKTVTVDPKANKIPGMATNKKDTVKKKQVHELTLLHTITGSQASDVIWSPAGNVCAMAQYAPDTCMFELHDVANNVQLASRRHDRGNRLVWDPSGRILASCTITDMKHANTRGHPGDGIILYTFQGNILCTQNHEKLFQFSWRPRPKNLLSADEKKKVIKNLRKYEKEFEKEDKIKRQELNQEVLQQRFRLAEEFLALLNRNKALSREAKATRVSLRDGYDSDDNRNYDINVVTEEQVLKTSEQIIG